MGNPKPYKPPSIEEQGGHRIWLDLLLTRAERNGHGVEYLENRVTEVQRLGYKVNIKQLAKEYGVSPPTVKSFLIGLGWVKDKDSGYWVPKDDNPA